MDEVTHNMVVAQLKSAKPSNLHDALVADITPTANGMLNAITKTLLTKKGDGTATYGVEPII